MSGAVGGAVSTSDTSADEGRWQDWQIGNRRDSRRGAMFSKIFATLALGAAIAWVAIELFASPAFA